MTKSLSPEMAALEKTQTAWLLILARPLLATGGNQLTSLGLSLFITQTGIIIVPTCHIGGYEDQVNDCL